MTNNSQAHIKQVFARDIGTSVLPGETGCPGPTGSAFAMINSVMTGTQAGKMYASTKGGWFFVLHRSGFGQLFTSDDEITSFSRFLNFVKSTSSLPAYFHLYDVNPSITGELLQDFNIRDRRRIQFRYETTTTQPVELPEGYNMVAIQESARSLLTDKDIQGWNVFWESIEDFTKTGFGSVAVDREQKPLAICYSAAVDSISAEVDVLTSESSRGIGLGKAVTNAFINQCIERAIVPAWDCFDDNHASIALAISCGFTRLRNYRFLSIFDPGK